MLIKEGYRSVVVAALLVFGSTATTSKASTIAADNLTGTYSLSSFEYGIGFAGSTSIGPFSNQTPAQEFTALVSGTVTTLTASVGQLQPLDVRLNVSIFDVASGFPGALVGTVSFAQAQV